MCVCESMRLCVCTRLTEYVYVCVYVCMYVCYVYTCMYVCLYVCIDLYMCMTIYTFV